MVAPMTSMPEEISSLKFHLNEKKGLTFIIFENLCLQNELNLQQERPLNLSHRKGQLSHNGPEFLLNHIVCRIRCI
jgi:hypothetical protein